MPSRRTLPGGSAAPSAVLLALLGAYVAAYVWTRATHRLMYLPGGPFDPPAVRAFPFARGAAAWELVFAPARWLEAHARTAFER